MKKIFWLFSVALILGVSLFALRAFLYSTNTMNSDAMLPNIAKGDTVTINKWGYGDYQTWGIDWFKTTASMPMKAGSVYAYRDNKEGLITHRLIGMPNDHIAIMSGKILVNDQLLQQTPTDKDNIITETLNDVSYQVQYSGKTDTGKFEYTLKNGEYFFIGDNRNHAHDSRFSGPIKLEKIVGIIE